MVNKNKWGEIQACYLLNKKGKLSATHLQPDQHPPSGSSQIPGATSRQETYLELPHLHTTETPGSQDQRIILDHRKTYPTFAEQQTTNLQDIFKPAWTYGIELWGCASPSNIAKIQRYQSKLLSLITNAPWFITNQTLYQELCIEKVQHAFREKAAAHHKTLSEYPNLLMGPLTDQPKQRRLNRRWTFDGIN